MRVECAPPLAAWLHGDVESRLVFMDEDVVSARVSGDGASIDLTLRADASPERHGVVADRTKRLVASLARTIEPRVRIIEEHRTLEQGCGCDADAALAEAQELHQEADGLAVLGPRLASAIERLDACFARLAGSLGAQPYQFPALIEPELLERLHAFQYFPHTLGFASHLRRDLDSLERFSASARAGPHGVDAPDGSFAAPRAMLTPAVCYHLYGYLANKTIEGGTLAATTRGKCFRHESSNMRSLERLWDFTVREIVFVGSADFVLARRAAVQDLARDVFSRLRLDHHVETAHDHFFGAEFRRQATLQSAFELKFEVRAAIAQKVRTLAVASYNYHQDFFGRRMNIGLPDGSIAHTACVGFGLERLVYALVSQVGLEGLDDVVAAACGQ